MADCRWNQRVGVCFALLLFAGAADGQEFRGRISGRVVDPQETAAPGASVTAIALDTGVTAKSNANAGSIYGRLGNGPTDPATGYRVNPYINPSAFQSLAGKYVVPTALPYYDDLRAPRTDSLNLSAFKSFRLWREGARMELRLDAQNAFNHPLFGSPSTALNNKSTFGVITSAGGNRLVEAGLRFAF